VDSPEIIPWAEISRRLYAVMEATPPTGKILHSREAKKVIRIKDIAKYCGIEWKTIYRLAKGERQHERHQRKLSNFFWAWDRGRLTKEEQVDGTWLIIYRDPQSQAHADEAGSGAVTPSRTLRVEVTPKGPQLKWP